MSLMHVGRPPLRSYLTAGMGGHPKRKSMHTHWDNTPCNFLTTECVPRRPPHWITTPNMNIPSVPSKKWTVQFEYPANFTHRMSDFRHWIFECPMSNIMLTSHSTPGWDTADMYDIWILLFDYYHTFYCVKLMCVFIESQVDMKCINKTAFQWIPENVQALSSDKMSKRPDGMCASGLNVQWRDFRLAYFPYYCMCVVGIVVMCV